MLCAIDNQNYTALVACSFFTLYQDILYALYIILFAVFTCTMHAMQYQGVENLST